MILVIYSLIAVESLSRRVIGSLEFEREGAAAIRRFLGPRSLAIAGVWGRCRAGKALRRIAGRRRLPGAPLMQRMEFAHFFISAKVD